MSDKSYESIKTLLASTNPNELHRGLDLVKREISRVGSKEAKPLFEMVSAVFYIDPLDHPELVPILNEAISLAVGFGDWVIPILLEQLDSGDLKAQMAISHALGRIGVDAIGTLMDEYKTSTETAKQTFILYALGKIKSPKVLMAVHLALEAAQSPNLELRDTAIRAIGKFTESIPYMDLPDDLRIAIIERLRVGLADSNPGIRAKAIRSMGKLARHKHLNAEELGELSTRCRQILGKDENFNWDRAYVVRKEAEEALGYI
ncbi:MAG: hypothetical protein GY839_07465 [candidate division Zixibacteria bacterium]|nr:hypothetical protein [candidate division Zixibacteria bacterium]